MNSFFKYGEGKVRFTDKGSGGAVVLLHGYLESYEVWESFMGHLSKEFRVIGIDLPGQGFSDVFSDEHSMEFMADAVKLLLDHLGIRKAFMVGHSLGGYVTLAFLELYPGMLSGYCLFHSHPFTDSPEALLKRDREISLAQTGRKDEIYPEDITRMFAAINLLKFKAELQRSMDIASVIPAEGIIAVLRGMKARPSRSSLMEEGRVPCLWILGALDNYINCEEVRKKVRLPENAGIVILKNSGHMGFVEEEEESLSAVRNFLRHLEV